MIVANDPRRNFPTIRPVISARYITTGVTNALGRPADFEFGIGDTLDGAYARKPDEGGSRYGASGGCYYFATHSSSDDLAYATFFSPSSQVPSPGILGGLPSRARETSAAPWETLLFCPNPAAGTTTNEHRGFVSPPDYLWMDLFTMPIVEPYAISEPFSTAGKLNMNYQIVPFTYVTRSSGLRALLAANRVTALQVNQSTGSPFLRYPIHLNETLKQFQWRFDNNQIFKSATEICSMWLYPGNMTTSTTALATDTAGSSTGITAWWYAKIGRAHV